MSNPPRFVPLAASISRSRSTAKAVLWRLLDSLQKDKPRLTIRYGCQFTSGDRPGNVGFDRPRRPARAGIFQAYPIFR